MQQTSTPRVMTLWTAVVLCCAWFTVGIEYLDVGEPGGDAAHLPRRPSAWMSRGQITAEYPSHDFPRKLDLQWTLFNASVLTAHAMVLANGRCIEHDLSVYDPHLK